MPEGKAEQFVAVFRQAGGEIDLGDAGVGEGAHADELHGVRDRDLLQIRAALKGGGEDADGAVPDREISRIGGVQADQALAGVVGVTGLVVVVGGDKGRDAGKHCRGIRAGDAGAAQLDVADGLGRLGFPIKQVSVDRPHMLAYGQRVQDARQAAGDGVVVSAAAKGGDDVVHAVIADDVRDCQVHGLGACGGIILDRHPQGGGVGLQGIAGQRYIGVVGAANHILKGLRGFR